MSVWLAFRPLLHGSLPLSLLSRPSSCREHIQLEVILFSPLFSFLILAIFTLFFLVLTMHTLFFLSSHFFSLFFPSSASYATFLFFPSIILLFQRHSIVLLVFFSFASFVSFPFPFSIVFLPRCIFLNFRSCFFLLHQLHLCVSPLQSPPYVGPFSFIQPCSQVYSRRSFSFPVTCIADVSSFFWTTFSHCIFIFSSISATLILHYCTFSLIL